MSIPSNWDKWIGRTFTKTKSRYTFCQLRESILLKLEPDKQVDVWYFFRKISKNHIHRVWSIYRVGAGLIITQRFINLQTYSRRHDFFWMLFCLFQKLGFIWRCFLKRSRERISIKSAIFVKNWSTVEFVLNTPPSLHFFGC